MKVAPFHKEALTAFAQLWLTVSRPKDAVKIAKKAASSAPDDPGSHRLYAQCLRCTAALGATDPCHTHEAIAVLADSTFVSCSECKQYNEALTAYNTALDLAKDRGDSIAVQDDMQVKLAVISSHHLLLLQQSTAS